MFNYFESKSIDKVPLIVNYQLSIEYLLLFSGGGDGAL